VLQIQQQSHSHISLIWFRNFKEDVTLPNLLHERPTLGYLIDFTRRMLLDASPNVLHWLIVKMLLGYAIRSTELAILTKNDVLWDEGCIRVHTNNHSERFVPFDTEFRDRLETYLNTRKTNSDLLLVSKQGYQYIPTTVCQTLRYIAKRAGIYRPLTNCFLKYCWIANYSTSDKSASELVKIIKFPSLTSFWLIAREIGAHTIFMKKYSDQLIKSIDYTVQNGVITDASYLFDEGSSKQWTGKKGYQKYPR